MEEDYAKFNNKQAMLNYEIKIEEGEIFEKQRHEKNGLICEVKRNNIGAFYHASVKLLVKHIKEITNIFIE